MVTVIAIVVVVAVGVVVGSATRDVYDMATCDVGVVAMAAETLSVSLCAVGACSTAFKANANNITEAASTAKKAIASPTIDVTAIARFNASVENVEKTHFREMGRHYRTATRQGKTSTGKMIGRFRSAVRTGKTRTGDETGDR